MESKSSVRAPCLTKLPHETDGARPRPLEIINAKAIFDALWKASSMPRLAVLAPTGSTGRGGYHGLEKRGERSKTVSAGCAIPDVQKHVIAYRSMPMHIRSYHYSPFHLFPIQRHQNVKTNRGQGFLDNNVVNELSTARWCGKWKTRQTIPNRCVVCQRQSTQTLA